MVVSVVDKLEELFASLFIAGARDASDYFLLKVDVKLREIGNYISRVYLLPNVFNGEEPEGSTVVLWNDNGNILCQHTLLFRFDIRLCDNRCCRETRRRIRKPLDSQSQGLSLPFPSHGRRIVGPVGVGNTHSRLLSRFLVVRISMSDYDSPPE